MNSEIQQHLDSLARDDCYRVDALLKDGKLESTERVFFVGKNGAEQGPYIRKRFHCESGLGSVYQRILSAQRSGVRFLHVPRIIDCYSTGEQDIVVMEYLSGPTLSDAVFASKSLVEFTLHVFPQICAAVQELHERFNPPLIHRDIKPTNFIVSGNEVFIIDFGIARTFDELALSDTNHFGTRSYAPPEQFGYGQTDVRSDVYALGMLLFYCFTGNVATNTDRTHNFSSKEIPYEFQEVIRQACQFSPDDGYQTVKELSNSFQNAIYMYHLRQKSNQLDAKTPYAGSYDERKNRSQSNNFLAKGKAMGATKEPLQATKAFIGMRPQELSDLGNRELNELASKPSLSTLITNCANYLSNKVPQGVGVAWNILLALFWLIIVSICFYLCFVPDAASVSAAHPFWFRVVEYPFFIGISTTCICYEFADRRRIRKKFPHIKKISLIYEFLIVAIAIPFLLAIVMTVIGVAAGF